MFIEKENQREDDRVNKRKNALLICVNEKMGKFKCNITSFPLELLILADILLRPKSDFGRLFRRAMFSAQISTRRQFFLGVAALLELLTFRQTSVKCLSS